MGNANKKVFYDRVLHLESNFHWERVIDRKINMCSDVRNRYFFKNVICSQLTSGSCKTLPFVYFHLAPIKVALFFFFTIKARTPDNNKMKSVRSFKVAVATIKMPSTLQLHAQVSKLCLLLEKSVSDSWSRTNSLKLLNAHLTNEIFRYEVFMTRTYFIFVQNLCILFI